MAVVYEKTLTPARLSIDITGDLYAMQVNGVNVTYPTQPANTRLVRLTASGVNYDFDASDFASVAFGPCGLSADALPGALRALGRLAAQSIVGGATQSAVFGGFGR